MKLNLVEVFDTIQGEGPYQGRPATFVRCGGCNLTCSWCDTPYSWDWSRYMRGVEVAEWPLATIADRLQDTDLVVLTGGEPLLQRSALADLVAAAPTVGMWQVETNGTVDPGRLAHAANVHYVVSPKLANGGDPVSARFKLPVLLAFSQLADAGLADLKIVVQTEQDVDDAQRIAYQLQWPAARVWLMPEGATRDAHLASMQRLAGHIAQSGLNLATRLHLLAWPDTTRGR